MQIVIEIPKGIYETICNNYSTDIVRCAIKNGTPLSEILGDIKTEIEEKMNDCATTSIYTRLGFKTSLQIINEHTRGRRTKMNYKALRFNTIYDLERFLNAHEMPRQDIVFINVKVSANGYGDYELLYMVADEE